MAINLFFVPHQDDEALTFGAGIRNHLDVGDECHVILYTDGRSSSVRKQLNGEAKSALTRRFYDPSAEGYGYLGEADMVRLRNDEFRRSCLALGVPETHIHFADGQMRDGSTTVEGCEAVLREYLRRYPDARVKAFTDLGGNHGDHANMGRAARRLARSGAIADLRLYVEPYNLRNARRESRRLELLVERSRDHAHRVVASLREYKRWDPASGQLAIGYHSVKRSIDAAIAKPVSYYHKP
ncbi:PIG-L family deacetylase [Cohnella sp. JJ-181]|uniref:PIG-L family deacetylase n=1 Tax=Cohnella rhizoplanae TaxID=2974897 RepID=UPI0022FF78B5|nr:PIG-L family deacetylase [Cohnella sp. JJ-181]CAI6071091.1 hypothetical protein COHCIP112018_02285 [Cohnella sp. JJ-181]